MSDQEDKRPMGRPRTTVADLPANWETLMTECGECGGSAAEARVMLDIGESAWRTLLADSEDFRRAEKRRKALCEVWWERRGRQMANGDVGNSAVWIFNMKNRFKWRDKPEEEEVAEQKPVEVIIRRASKDADS